MSSNYQEYLQSDHWKKLAEETKRLAGYRCQVCNSDTNLQTHHRTYDRKGDEFQSDLTCLCADCHNLFHGKNKNNANICVKISPKKYYDENVEAENWNILYKKLSSKGINKDKYCRRMILSIGNNVSFTGDLFEFYKDLSQGSEYRKAPVFKFRTVDGSRGFVDGVLRCIDCNSNNLSLIKTRYGELSEFYSMDYTCNDCKYRQTLLLPSNENGEWYMALVPDL